MNSFRLLTFLGSLNSPCLTEKRRAELETVRDTLGPWEDICHHCHTHAELEQALQTNLSSHRNCLVVLDILDENLSQILARSAIHPEVLLVVDECEPQPTQKQLEPVSHFLSIAHGPTAITTLISTIKKIASQQIFGAEKYLSYGTPLHFLILSRSEDREWFVERFMDYVAGLEGIVASGAAEYARMAGEVLDELLMNAVWDANPNRAQSDRNIPVVLNPSETVKVEWGVDGDLLAVGVRDPFGSFSKETLFQYHEEALGGRKPPQLTVNPEGVSAGIGLHKVMRRVSGLVVNLAPGFCTEVVALFDLTHSPRILAKCPKNLHFFSL